MRQAKGRAAVDEWVKQSPEFYKRINTLEPQLTPEYKQWLYIVAVAFTLGVCWGALICLMLG